MARDGYLILDSDLHMMEPDDLWPVISFPPYRQTAALLRCAAAATGREFDRQRQRRHIEGMVVQGLAILAHGKSPGRPRRGANCGAGAAAHPHFNVARARGFDPISTLTAMVIEGIDVAVMYGTRAGRSYVMTICRRLCGALARAYNDWAADYCKTDPQRLKFAAQIAMHDVPTAVDEHGAA